MKNAIALLTAFYCFILSPLTEAAQNFSYDQRRGSPSEYDPGPVKGSSWARLFAQTPNYRALGEEILGKTEDEKFRWIFGPMWYRGRLGHNEVKVFVVGQEGAQDENVTNRAFTGSTGTKTQKFLNHLGVQHSYIFLNTFVYTINGQLDSESPKFKWLEQGETSPIVEYRHKLFDNVANENPDTLTVLLGVGSGGKASVATWVNSRSGAQVCSPSYNLYSCDTSIVEKRFGLKNKLLVIGVPHPGAANPHNGGDEAYQMLVADFSAAARKANAFFSKNTSWFETLDEVEGLSASEKQSKIAEIKDRLEQDYVYGNAPVPFRDFAFGTNWRMGAEGTTSNRKKSDSIQIFSDDGLYNNSDEKKGIYHNVSYESVRDNKLGLDYSNGEVRVPGMLDEDLAYESPSYVSSNPDHSDQYDYGPCGNTSSLPKQSCRMSELLQDWSSASYNWVGQVAQHASFGHGPIYRGNLQNPEILVLADQMSHDDMFSARALTGEAGQKLQRLLEISGVKTEGSYKNYAIIRTLPVDTMNLSSQKALALATDWSVVSQQKKIFDELLSQGKTKMIITLGDQAKALASKLNLNVDVHLQAPIPFNGYIFDWEKAGDEIAHKLGKHKYKPFYESQGGKYIVKLAPIPRTDLPAHSRWWMGTTGTRASRGYGSSEVNGNYYKVTAPRWVKYLNPKPLSWSEKQDVRSRMDQAGL